MIQGAITKNFAPLKPLSNKTGRLFERSPVKCSKMQPEVQKSVAAPINVNYVAKGFDHKRPIDTAALLLMDTILSKGYLWDEVRVLGGAYGCFLSTGMWMKQYIVSYRDPNLLQTIEKYQRVVDFI